MSNSRSSCAACRVGAAGFFLLAAAGAALADDARRGWGPEQALGRADTPGAGDRPTAWASATEDDRDEWLILEFGEAVVPSAVRVFATFHPGALVKVSAFEADGPAGAATEAPLWEGPDPSPPGAPRAVTLIPTATSMQTKRVRLHLASRRARGWNQIDAVYLHGPDGSFQPAIWAEASSTFAPGEATSPVREPAAPPRPLSELEAGARTPADGLFAVYLDLRARGVAGDSVAALAREMAAVQRAASAAPAEVTFAGRWETTFGVLQMALDGDRATGVYPLGAIEGTLTGDRLTFTYREADVEGEGWFRLAADGQAFEGRWRAKGEQRYREWAGERAREEPGRRWLVVLEAPWQEDLGEAEYSFGGMLRAIFGHAEGIEVRQRYFTDARSFEAYCREIALLPGEVYLVVASHASVAGLDCQAGRVSTEAVARALAQAPNLKLVHFSACDVMAGPMPDRILAARPAVDALEGVSGYSISVDWMASALTEFAYLDLLLNRELDPARAAEQLRRALDFADDRVAPGSAIPAAHFRLRLKAAKAPAVPAPARPGEAPRPDQAPARTAGPM